MVFGLILPPERFVDPVRVLGIRRSHEPHMRYEPVRAPAEEADQGHEADSREAEQQLEEAAREVDEASLRVHTFSPPEPWALLIDESIRRSRRWPTSRCQPWCGYR